MSFIIEEVKKYKVFLYSKKPNQKGAISFKIASGAVKIIFAEGRLKANKIMENSNKKDMVCYVKAEYFGDYVDLMRNEKPIYFYFDEKTKTSLITTSDEPIGEGEK